MEDTLLPTIQQHFGDLTDPRIDRTKLHELISILVIAICAVICGADDFVAIAKFGRAKREWLSRFLDLSSGIPSHDRFNHVLATIKPVEFEKCLLSWVTALHEITGGQLQENDEVVINAPLSTSNNSVDGRRGPGGFPLGGFGG